LIQQVADAEYEIDPQGLIAKHERPALSSEQFLSGPHQNIELPPPATNAIGQVPIDSIKRV